MHASVQTAIAAEVVRKSHASSTDSNRYRSRIQSSGTIATEVACSSQARIATEVACNKAPCFPRYVVGFYATIATPCALYAHEGKPVATHVMHQYTMANGPMAYFQHSECHANKKVFGYRKSLATFRVSESRVGTTRQADLGGLKQEQFSCESHKSLSHE